MYNLVFNQKIAEQKVSRNVSYILMSFYEYCVSLLYVS